MKEYLEEEEREEELIETTEEEKAFLKEREEFYKNEYKKDHELEELEKSSGLGDDEFYKKVKKANYDSYNMYINMHHKPIAELPSKKKDKCQMICKALAADILRKSPRDKYQFDIDKVHYVAERIGKAINIEDVGVDKITQCAEDHKKALEMLNDRICAIYEVKDPAAYIKNMRQVLKNMMPQEGRTQAYQNFYNSVQKVAYLDPKDEHIAGKIVEANFNLMRYLEGYTKGKKSVRFHDDGKARFDNSMDVLSVMASGTTGVKDLADSLVTRINTVRKTNPGDKYYVDLDSFGPKRAEEAKKNREAKLNKGKKQTILNEAVKK